MLPNTFRTHQRRASAGSGGRGGAVFVGKRSSLVVEETVVAHSYAGSKVCQY